MRLNLNKEVGLRIKDIRENKLGLSMSDFAGKIDSTSKSGTVSNWETGKNLPNKKRLIRIAELGNMHINELLYGSEFNYIKKTVEKYFDSYDENFFGYLSATIDFTNSPNHHNNIYELSVDEIISYYDRYLKGYVLNNYDQELNLGAHLYLAANEVDNEHINAASKYYKQRFNKSTEEAYNELNDK